jgi:hypothetical protein
MIWCAPCPFGFALTAGKSYAFDIVLGCKETLGEDVLVERIGRLTKASIIGEDGKACGFCRERAIEQHRG